MNGFTFAMLLLLFVVLAGCGVPPNPDGSPVSKLAAYSASTYDQRYGVVCYRYASSSNNLSCVKVD